jgi:transposase
MLIGGSVKDVLVWTCPIDMRKSIDGLCVCVVESLLANPGDGKIYVFFNRGLDKLKLIYWGGNGFCLLYKRLEKGRFQLPKQTLNPWVIRRSELEYLLSGLCFEKWPQRREEMYEKYA